MSSSRLAIRSVILVLVGFVIVSLSRSSGTDRALPTLAAAGELLKLGAELIIQEEGKVAAEQNVRKLLER
jgi:hypothetical protein